MTYSACLASKIEEMFATGKRSLPGRANAHRLAEFSRAASTRRSKGITRLDTPHLDVTYRAPARIPILPRLIGRDRPNSGPKAGPLLAVH